MNSTQSQPPAAGEAAHTRQRFVRIAPPLRINTGEKGAHLIDSRNQVIATCDRESAAMDIRRACNSHAALVAALESIARAPTFDTNTQTIVDLAQRTLKAIAE